MFLQGQRHGNFGFTMSSNLLSEVNRKVSEASRPIVHRTHGVIVLLLLVDSAYCQ